jgi:hypothetical protein
MLIFARWVAVMSGNDSGNVWCATKRDRFEFEGEGAALTPVTPPPLTSS